MLDHISKALPVVSGIPQGSILGPFLFNTVIGSLAPVQPSTKIIKYIDDCTYVIPIDAANSKVPSVEHGEILRWSRVNGLSINLQKSKWIWIPKRSKALPPSIPDITLEKVVRILGVFFSSDLKWDSHFETVVKFASKRLFCLRVLRPLLSKNDLKTVYQSLIRTLIEYCNPLFVGMTNRNREYLRKFQQRAHRIICDRGCDCEIFEDLSSRRLTSAIKYFRKVEQLVHHPLHHLCPTKSERSERYFQIHAKTTRRLRSFFPAMVINFNKTFLD